MGKVVISPNIKKTSERIDFNGNIINPRTKEIIVPKESDYVPPTPLMPIEEIPTTIEQPKSDLSSKISSKIEEIVNKKVEEMVNKKIEEALKNL